MWTPRPSPGPESGPPHRRLSSEARAARNEAIARRRLEGASITKVMEEYSVSRNTVKRATRDHAASLARREPEELAALDLSPDPRAPPPPRPDRQPARGSGAAGDPPGRAPGATSRLEPRTRRAGRPPALIVALIRTGYLPRAGGRVPAPEGRRGWKVWGVELARMAERAGLADEEFERMLGRVADDARFQSGLALITTNGREY